MQHKRILITGASGFLGWNIARHFTDLGCIVTGTWHSVAPDRSVAAEWVKTDLDVDAPKDIIAASACDAVVHCAAIAGRAACESDAGLAVRINTRLPGELAVACAEQALPFVHISTDLVFDGCGGPYREDADMHPLSVYAKTKADAETDVLRTHPGSYIIRTALMYGAGPFGEAGSMLSWTLQALKTGKPLHLYTNQYRSLLYAPDVARLVTALIGDAAPPGIYHAGGPERLSRYEAGLRIAAAFGYSAEGIIPTTLERQAGLTPDDDASLDCSRTIGQTGMRFTTLEEGLRDMGELRL